MYSELQIRDDLSRLVILHARRARIREMSLFLIGIVCGIMLRWLSVSP